jgi:hypothetical protein
VAEIVEEFSFAEYAIDDRLSRLRWLAAFGKLGHRTMGLLTITLRLPGTIGFTTRAHPTLQGQEELIGPSRGRIIVSRLTQGNHRFIGPADSFSDSLLDPVHQWP